ncbi:MAG: thiol-disulfide isomerase/thioredoxin [Myxococcota bacterium]|jgi:thiol-disulfide isomerase/thioredoxin
MTTTTPPAALDSDGDTYLDDDELHEGTDPFDPRDRIYKGYWPYWRDKDSLGERSFEGEAGGVVVGERFPRFRGMDHRGDIVDLYDFGGPDQRHEYILIDSCAMWCPPCQDLSAWVAGIEPAPHLEEPYGALRTMINSGQLAYITIETENYWSEPPTQDELREWHKEFPHARVPVLGDSDREMLTHVNGPVGGWPVGVLIRAEDMQLMAMEFMVPDLLDVALEHTRGRR